MEGIEATRRRQEECQSVYRAQALGVLDANF